MIQTFHMRPSCAELEDYFDNQPLVNTRMVFNPKNGAIFVRFTPKTDAEMVHFKMKWSDSIHSDGSVANILANIIHDQSIRDSKRSADILR